MYTDDPFPAFSDFLHKVNYLLEFMDSRGLLDDHSFTFPDGETWSVPSGEQDHTVELNEDTHQDEIDLDARDNPETPEMTSLELARKIHMATDEARALVEDASLMLQQGSQGRAKLIAALGKLDFVVGELEKIDN